MDEATITAMVKGTTQLIEAHFGQGVSVNVIRPLVLPDEPDPDKTPDSLRSIEANAIPDIEALLGDCERCTLCKTRRNIVFGAGNPRARLVVLGEAPGRHEDLLGEPFVGKAGAMLDAMLAWLLDIEKEWVRQEVYILNVIKCRPPGNRNPAAEEIAACLPFLRMQLATIKPRFILLMGAVALRALFEVDHGISRHRGQWMKYEDIDVMPTFHPAYLLRQPGDKRLAFSDLQLLKDRMNAGENE